MAETLTPNYGWTKPDPGASSNVWGTEINSDLDKIDNQVFLNAGGNIPIGSGALFFGLSAPTNWYLCQGQSLPTAVPNDKLFAVIGYTYGGSGANFNLPDLSNVFAKGAAVGGAIGSEGGEATHVLTVPEMPSHTHTLINPAHTHGLTQSPHVHPDPGHTHIVSDPGHAHSGVLRPGSGTFNLGVNNPQSTPGNTDANGTGITIAAAVTNIQPTNANLTINAAATAVSAVGTGGGSAHNNLPPFLTVNIIIRFL